MEKKKSEMEKLQDKKWDAKVRIQMRTLPSVSCFLPAWELLQRTERRSDVFCERWRGCHRTALTSHTAGPFVPSEALPSCSHSTHNSVSVCMSFITLEQASSLFRAIVIDKSSNGLGDLFWSFSVVTGGLKHPFRAEMDFNFISKWQEFSDRNLDSVLYLRANLSQWHFTDLTFVGGT